MTSASNRFSKENFPRILELVDTVGAIGKKYNATPGQVALAWLLAQRTVVAPIVNAFAPQHVEELMQGAAVTLLRSQVADLTRAGD